MHFQKILSKEKHALFFTRNIDLYSIYIRDTLCIKHMYFLIDPNFKV